MEELCKVIARQKQIGQTISNEVDHQNGNLNLILLILYQFEDIKFTLKVLYFYVEIIDNLSNHMDRTDESLITKTQHVQTINFKDRTCGYWIVIILLFICIIIVALLP